MINLMKAQVLTNVTKKQNCRINNGFPLALGRCHQGIEPQDITLAIPLALDHQYQWSSLHIK